ncbi:MAG: hypothetical protein F9K16_02975 [Thermoanaerobaculia bacterium]|nr:MAG: hypothetical protein F9K16_02975 [Thermoanaerobaculia bacterium]MBZ0102121.1 hypothetical protein [Thermoanaerobaculia bacterium]
MKAQDLLDAETLWGALKQDGARQVAKSELTSQIRTTGLESTLRWLEAKSAPLRDALCDTLNIPKDLQARGQRTNLEVLSDSRRAQALADALHLVARIR